MKGRKPLPTALKLIKGSAKVNPGRVNWDEPVPPAGKIECPGWLPASARTFWDEWEPILSAMRIMTTADLEALATMCETQAEFVTARQDVHRRGTEIEYTRYAKNGEPFTVMELNPNVRIASDAMKRVARMMVEFGMTPSSRSRIKAQKPKDEGEDRWEGLL